MNQNQSCDSSGAKVAFPENELPKWLLQHALQRLKRVFNILRRPPYESLARFSHDFGLCVRSSSDITRSLELCLKPLRRSKLGELWSGSVERVRRGSSIADALSTGEERLPPFYLPVIKAGELSGRLDDAFSFLESHCKLLAGPTSALRNLWLFPVAIMLFGSIMKVLMHLLLGSVTTAFSTLASELFSWAQIFLIVAIVIITPLGFFFGQLRLAIPFAGDLEREIALHRFFRIMALLYSVGGHRVEVMIQTAAKTVGNPAARVDLLRAAKAVENGATISDAFRQVRLLSEDEKVTIEVGEMSGVLERTFDQISDDTGSSMMGKLKIIQPILTRIVMTMVMLSIIGTALSLLAGV